MNLKERRNTKLRKITITDINGNVLETAKYCIIDEAEGNVLAPGTTVTEELLNSINWRTDSSIELRSLGSVPNQKANTNQIVVLDNGDMWLIPRSGSGQARKLDGVSVETKSPEDSRDKSGIDIQNGKIVIKSACNAQEGTNGQYHGNRGTVTIVNENGLVNNQGVLRVNKAGSGNGATNNFGTVQIKEENGLSINNGLVSISKASMTTSGTLSGEDYERLLYGKLVYSGSMTLNRSRVINFDFDVLDSGYKYFIISAAEAFTSGDDSTDYDFNNSVRHEIYIPHVEMSDSDSYYVTFSFMMGLSGTTRTWISGNFGRSTMTLYSYTSQFNSISSSQNNNQIDLEIRVK